MVYTGGTKEMMRFSGIKRGLISWSNEFYSIANSRDILWLMADEDPDKDEHANGGYEYRVIKTDNINMNDHIDDIQTEGGTNIAFEIIENRTVNCGYIDCDENGNAYLSQIEDIKIKHCLCGFDSCYSLEGYVTALVKNDETHIAETLINIITNNTSVNDEEDQLCTYSYDRECAACYC